MANSSLSPTKNSSFFYRLGAYGTLFTALLIIFSVIGFFIWPYQGTGASAQEIFLLLQQDLFGGLIALDFPFLVIDLIIVVPLLVLYTALKKVHPHFALLALILGLMAAVTLIFARPVVELITLSNRYAAAATQAERDLYLAAGESLLVLWDGTGWMVTTVFNGISGLISSLLMLKSDVFRPGTAYLGIITSLPGFGFFIPGLAPVLLMLGTFGGILWYILIARDLLRNIDPSIND